MVEPPANTFYFEHPGFCPVCEQTTIFSARGPYFRNTLICNACRSLPRHRALVHALTKFGLPWKSSALHECSPGKQHIAKKIATECRNYVATHYDPKLQPGSIVVDRSMPCGSYRIENLEKQTFADEIFDLVITQDVFEHLFHPDKAIAEIARTLKPGGATVMTVPLMLRHNPSRRRAALEHDQVVSLLPDEFHGNPISGSGSLVTIDWGLDILQYLHQASGLSFFILDTNDIDLGIRADLNEVILGFKYPRVAF